MPYIEEQIKKELGFRHPDTPGELNYLITELILKYYSKSQRNYQAVNDILGALEGAKMEFYRRLAVPYEDKKRGLNGDVGYEFYR